MPSRNKKRANLKITLALHSFKLLRTFNYKIIKEVIQLKYYSNYILVPMWNGSTAVLPLGVYKYLVKNHFDSFDLCL
nr:MAG TPA: hypothetical protein [Caudoviricetes sp.]